VLAVSHTNEDGREETVTGVRRFIGRWNAAAEGDEWTASAPVAVSRGVSSRGLMEPAIAELRTAEPLLGMRGPNTETTPGRAWISVSSDGGTN